MQAADQTDRRDVPAEADSGWRRAARAARSWTEWWGGALAAIVVVAATCAHVAYYFPRVVDDLFISLRYAENLARGNGAVYNVGERVEGYSSPLFMFLQSVGFVLRLEGVTWTKVLGLLSLAGIQYGLYRLAKDAFGIRRWLAWLPALFCAANSYVVNWTVLGLETPLHLAAIVWCPVAIHAYLTGPNRRSRLWAVLALVALGTTRPESILYVAVNVVAPFLAARSRRDLVDTARSLFRVALYSGGALAVLLLARWLYYGHVVPNTYFVKGANNSFDVERLASLVAQGATFSEALVYAGGGVLLLGFGWRRRALAPALSVLACCYFGASVILDWMPSLRHLLPVTVLAPLGWVCLADEFAKCRPVVQLAAIAPVAILGHAAYSVAIVDNRYSPEENRGRGWLLLKSDAKWRDTILAYRRVEPPHVATMGTYEMGQISQCWCILETSVAPVADSWFVGRDIGAVGYFTGARIFDTAGLFTAAVSHSAAWTERRQVDDELIRTAMSRKPVGGEIYEGWETALGQRPDLFAGYRVRLGTRSAPYAFIAADRVPPAREEIVRRYGTMRSRFPRLYHLHTLYGESVGAVIERRIRIVAEQLSR